ncbi:hypothetical protein DYBT9275_03237 [Dyadobacter sp. CECT 9275]|uniref:Uncharacterized protein n=1 Tax=Dyadobacter helix TaxID=2822344 RepID=A0A916JEJ2_9BACT|nr:hypothetical protein DYBT9275_03237 [Dyadobacter sp. CECT 9275]
MNLFYDSVSRKALAAYLSLLRTFPSRDEVFLVGMLRYPLTDGSYLI